MRWQVPKFLETLAAKVRELACQILSTAETGFAKCEPDEVLARVACGRVASSQQHNARQSIFSLRVAIVSRFIGLVRGTQNELHE